MPREFSSAAGDGMDDHLVPRYTVALRGFSDFERSTLTSFFRLAADRSPAYAQSNAADHADFWIADADHAATLAEVQAAGRVEHTVFVGATPPSGAMACLNRPIDPHHILRELDQLLETRLAGFQEPASSGWHVPPMSPNLLDETEVAGGPPQPLKDVLVVDDSPIARRFLQVRLQELGYRVHLAELADEALQRLDAQSFTLVFLDITLGPDGSLDGLALCQHAKQVARKLGRPEPAVVMVTGSSSSADRVRGHLAGCDAYLTKPLMEDEFLQTLRQFDPDLAAATDRARKRVESKRLRRES